MNSEWNNGSIGEKCMVMSAIFGAQHHNHKGYIRDKTHILVYKMKTEMEWISIKK